jgi:hypothetical protein
MPYQWSAPDPKQQQSRVRGAEGGGEAGTYAAPASALETLSILGRSNPSRVPVNPHPRRGWGETGSSAGTRLPGGPHMG